MANYNLVIIPLPRQLIFDLCSTIFQMKQLICFYLQLLTLSMQKQSVCVIYLQMQGNKLTLNVRKVVKKQPKIKFHVKTEKLASQSKNSEVVSRAHQEKVHNSKHSSVITRKTSTNNLNIKTRESTSLGKGLRSEQRKFPQIYNPAISSAKHFDIKKHESKYKIVSTHSVIEKRNIDTQNLVQKEDKPLYRKRELSSAQRSLKLTEIEPLKQMSKQKKIQLFKAIRSEFNDLINTTNNLSVKNSNISFKAFVEKGNNGILVREIMKKRWWWHVEEDKTKANLVWTEWLDKSATNNLKNLTCIDQTMDIDDYQIKSNSESHNKYESIRKLVDTNTFNLLEKKINLNAQNYFKTPKGTGGFANGFWSNEHSQQLKVHTVGSDQMIHNHVQGCLHLHSKKLLFTNFHKFMIKKQWDPFMFIPLTFYIQEKNSPMITQLLSKYSEFQQKQKDNKQLKNIWICKPGENSNRGCGIKVVKSKQQILSQIENRLPESNSGNRSVIIQKYIEKCFLINNRKFDIRCYILLTTTNGILKGYWYKDGYIRTSSLEYNLDDTSNQMIHLTNDAVQKKGEDFGKHEDSNKLSFDYFKQYLKKSGISPAKFDESYNQMKLIAYYLICSVSSKIKRKQFTFQLFGLDFMLDENLNPFLIEANSNPCLSNHGKILGKLIHDLVENVFMTAIDPVFPPPIQHLQKKKIEQLNKDYFETNKFELLFAGKSKKLESEFQTSSQNKEEIKTSKN